MVQGQAFLIVAISRHITVKQKRLTQTLALMPPPQAFGRAAHRAITPMTA